MRRLLLLVSAIVLVDTMFYAAITPLLPYYSHRLALSKGAAGLLAGAYPAGTLIGSLPGGWLAAHVGVRPTVLVGLALLGFSSLAFGLGTSIGVLDAARFAQGVGGAASWAGGLAWLVGATHPERRGETIGKAFAAALGGALLGPVLGGLARASAPAAVFGAVAAVAAALAAAALRTPAERARDEQARGSWRALRDARLVVGACLVVLVGLFFGTLEVLVPLRLDRLGAGAAVIAATFLISAGLQGLASPPFGRWLDRSGWRALTRAALVCGIAIASTIPWLGSAWSIAALAAVSGLAVGGLWIPALTLLSDGAEQRGLDQGYAFALVNLLWAAAQVAGEAGGSRLAQATADAVPYLLLAALFAAVLARVSRPGTLAGGRTG